MSAPENGVEGANLYMVEKLVAAIANMIINISDTNTLQQALKIVRNIVVVLLLHLLYVGCGLLYLNSL